MHHIVVAILIGIIGGVVAALCGGGVVMVPAFVLLLKMDQKGAVATSLAAIVFTALCVSFKNHANGFILWKVAIPAGIAGGIVGWLAADWLKKLQDVTLILMRVQVESNDPRPCADAFDPFAIFGKAGQALLKLAEHSGHVCKHPVWEFFLA